MIEGKAKGKERKGQKRGSLELPVTSWQVFGLVLLAGVGLSVLLVFVVGLLLVSPERFEQLLALLMTILKVAAP